MKLTNSLTVVLGVAIMAACGGPGAEDGADSTGGSGMSKEDARNAGKADGADFCEVNEWYGDGACDEFCQLPDPDCGSNGG